MKIFFGNLQNRKECLKTTLIFDIPFSFYFHQPAMPFEPYLARESLIFVVFSLLKNKILAKWHFNQKYKKINE